MAQKARLSEIDITLDAAQHFITDDIFVAELDDRVAFFIERQLRKPFILEGELTQPGAGAFRLGGKSGDIQTLLRFRNGRF